MHRFFYEVLKPDNESGEIAARSCQSLLQIWISLNQGRLIHGCNPRMTARMNVMLASITLYRKTVKLLALGIHHVQGAQFLLVA